MRYWRRDWAASYISGKDSHGKSRRDGQAPILHTGYRARTFSPRRPELHLTQSPPARCPAEMGAQATPPRCCDFAPQRSHHHHGPFHGPRWGGSWGQPRVSSLLGLQEPVGVGASPRAQIRALGVGGSRTFTEGQMRAAGTRVHAHICTCTPEQCSGHEHMCLRVCAHMQFCGLFRSLEGPPPRLGPDRTICPLNTCPGNRVAPAWLRGPGTEP